MGMMARGARRAACAAPEKNGASVRSDDVCVALGLVQLLLQRRGKEHSLIVC
jgi:hypothetical protein